MKKLTIKYEMTFSCDEYLLEKINYEWTDAVKENEGETEKEIFETALAWALDEFFSVSMDEIEAILTQSDKIYKWWKENKKNV